MSVRQGRDRPITAEGTDSSTEGAEVDPEGPSPAAIDALLLDYEMGREDERVHSNLTVALVGVIAALLAGIAAIVTGDEHFKQGDGYNLPDAVSAFIPLLPLALGGLLVMQGISATLRGLYLRQVEASLRKVAGSSLPDYPDLHAPSAHELNQAVISPIRGRPGYRALLALVLLTNFIAYAGVVYLAAETVDTLWVKIAMYIGYGAGELFCFYQVLGATTGGRTVLQKTADSIYAYLHYPHSLQPRAKDEPVARTGRSLFSYLLLPRPGELIKWLFVPICALLGALVLDTAPWDEPLRFCVAWLVFEYLTYQARYQWNDIRGLSADRLHRFARSRARLPVGRRGEKFSVSSSLLVLVARIAVVIAVIVGDPFDSGSYILWASAAAWLLAILYESLRSSSESTSDLRSRSVIVVAGGGYAVRAVLGFSLAAIGPLPGAAALLLSLAAWSFGVMFVSMTWLLDAYSSTTIESLESGRRLVYFPATAAGRSLRSKPHFVLLLKTVANPVARDGVPAGGVGGESVHPLRSARRLRVPWNVALIVASCSGAAGLLALTPADATTSTPSVLIVLLASTAMTLSASPRAAVVPFVLGGFLLHFPFSAMSLGAGIAGPALWIVLGGLYLVFRNSSYLDLTVAPVESLVAVLDRTGELLLGSSWRYYRPARFEAITPAASPAPRLPLDAG